VIEHQNFYTEPLSGNVLCKLFVNKINDLEKVSALKAEEIVVWQKPGKSGGWSN